MDNEKRLEKEKKILQLKDEVALLRAKTDELEMLAKEYTLDYFNEEREEYAYLKQIPKHYSMTRHVLAPYSGLNVDLIGYMIAILFYDYEHKEMVVERKIASEMWNSLYGTKYQVKLPYLSIRNLADASDNIEIDFSDSFLLKNFPMEKPVIWMTDQNGYEHVSTNYTYLIGYNGELNFDYVKREVIKELVYSMAYYQKQHDITYMDADKTWDVFKKIYKK